MRGKRAALAFLDGSATFDALGRPTTTEVVLGEARGSITPPDLTPEGQAGSISFDAVAFVSVRAAGEYLTKRDSANPLPWIRVTDAGILDGDYSITRISGGRRIMRLGLNRTQRRDGSSGRL